jgi:pimeloyl-ACP methyl ester carboxylesterase
VAGLFVPGWGAPRGLYAACVPDGWEVLQPPPFRATGGDLGTYRRWLAGEVEARARPLTLAGHSMGAVLSVYAALDVPDAIERLVLISPAGLPLEKPIWKSTLSLLHQIVHGLYPAGELWRATKRTLSAPRAALRLAQSLRELDLGPELARVRAAGIPCTVIVAASDRLTTPEICGKLATQLGAGYRELDVEGGHVWMLHQPDLLRSELAGPSTAPHNL